jgi:hypothetical protein
MVVKAARELLQMNRNFAGVADPAGFGSGSGDSDSESEPPVRPEQAINYVIRGLNKMKEMKKDEEDDEEPEEGQVGHIDDVIGCLLSYRSQRPVC